MAAASSDECGYLIRKSSDDGHMFTYDFTVEELGDKGPWTFHEEFQTNCESNPTSWLCEIQFRKVSDYNIAKVSLSLRRTDSGDNDVCVSIIPFIKDSAERPLFKSKTFDMRDVSAGHAIVEDLVEDVKFPHLRIHFNRKLYVHLSISIISCHE
ncbi:hypothetical protein AVEN_128759-1 [Araneus ventricosus]|uniref:MATH domain-containing protein n=1 Tax=Araneus ventricosus TaxID=182803 RepID=A0A4Y2J449_ARAVE|nr:hypothetical protein AVEN_128759-1 [Araneus ventricosus]